MVIMRARIGIVSAGWNDEYQRKVITGITEVCKEYDYDTLSFTSSNLDYSAEIHNRCAYNIYNLLNEKHMDALILIINTIYYEEVIEAILNKAGEMKIPVVCIDLEHDGMFCVGTDNYNSAKIMVEHLLADEKRSRFACLTGVASNPENISRVQAFKDSVTAKKGGFLEHYIYQGNFQIQCGIDAADFWHNSEEEYPDAIFCANDVSARGFLDRSLELGYRVPEDVKIVAFDNTFNGQYARVPLSSLASPLEEIGQEAVRMIHAIKMGEKVERKKLIAGTPFFRESSGHNSANYEQNYKQIYEQAAKKTKVDEHYLFYANLMTDRFSLCNSFEDLLEALKMFIEELNCSGFYLCFTKEQMTSLVDDLTLVRDEKVGYMLEGYSDYMYMPMFYEDGIFLEPQVFETQKILPVLENEKNERMDYVFFPLYFKGKTHGYCAVANCNSVVYGCSFQTWLATLSYAVNNIFLHQELDKKAKELEILHERDAMTGAYNRLGFSKHSARLMKVCIDKGCEMMVLFADMDDMKYINDQFGHEEGDRAICAFCSALKKSCKEGEIVARFGGDEMVVLAGDYSEQKAIDFATRFQEELDHFNKENTLYELRVSIGYDVFSPDAETNLDKCLDSADANMYQEKYRRKKYSPGRGSRR